MAGTFLEQLVMPHSVKLIMSLEAYSFIIRVNRRPPLCRVSATVLNTRFTSLSHISPKSLARYPQSQYHFVFYIHDEEVHLSRDAC